MHIGSPLSLLLALEAARCRQDRLVYLFLGTYSIFPEMHHGWDIGRYRRDTVCCLYLLDIELVNANVLTIGKLVHMRVMGRSILLVDDLQVAVDLLEKRSTIYSSRPASTAVEL